MKPLSVHVQQEDDDEPRKFICSSDNRAKKSQAGEFVRRLKRLSGKASDHIVYEIQLDMMIVCLGCVPSVK